MKVACLCPTYRRPFCLRNAVACFEAQTYENRELIVLDDAGQYRGHEGDRWRVISVPLRFRSLPAKFNALASLSDADAFCVWEDDDIYLPWHVEAHAHALSGGAAMSVPRRIMDACGPRGWNVRENAGCMFHASWAYSREGFDAVGGYPLTGALTFDVEMLDRMRAYLGAPADPALTHPPSYLYRWQQSGAYNGSQFGPGWYEAAGRLSGLPGDNLGTIARIEPLMDNATRLLYADWGQVTDESPAMAGRSAGE